MSHSRAGGIALAVALTGLGAPAAASPDSAATLAWRAAADLPTDATPTWQVGADAHSNLMVRGVPLFHRHKEDFLSQKYGVVPELRHRLTPSTELTWATAVAIQDRAGIRAEIPHTDLTQELRARHHFGRGGLWEIIPAAGLLTSFQEGGSARIELSGTAVRRMLAVDIEWQLLHHQAVFGEDPLDVALLYAHLQLSHSFRPGNWLLLPLLRASGEGRVASPTDGPAVAAQGGLLVSYDFGWPLRFLTSAQGWWRGDLDAWTMDLSVGLQATFGGP